MSGSTSSSPRGDAQHAGSRSASVDAASPSGSHDEKNDLKKGAAMEHTLHHRRQPPSAEIEHAPGAFEHGPGNPMSGPGTAADTAVDTPYPRFASDLPWSARTWYYQLMPFRGMYYDLRRRLPFFVTDWTTAFKPDNWWTVAQYVVRMYFINLMPAISYIIDMNYRTDGAYGLNEVILASALAAIVFPIFSIQPLTFVGVTGLINLVNYTQYDLVVEYYGLDRLDYLRVQAWSLIWAAGFHFIVSIFNICDYTRFITDMTSQTFGFYVGIVYIQKGIELLILEFEPAPLDNATGWLSVTIAILFTVSVYLVSKIGKTSFGPFQVRYFVSSFAFAAGCVFWTGFSHFPRNSLERVPIERLPITRSFFPSIDRPWFIDFWNIELRWVFVGAPLGFLIMLLFYFDHNVSSVMAQARQFPVKRPAGFHWDFFLLGITTLVSGFLGLPAPNGLVPQCPWSTESLSVFRQVDKVTDGNDEEKPPVGKRGRRLRRQHVVNTRVVENRVGHLIVGLLTLGTMTRPLLVALGTMPRALFAGVFILVGWSSIEDNVITTRTLAVFKDRRVGSESDGLNKVRRSKIALFVGIQWLFFAMTIAISQTIAAIGFPVIIVLLIPFRYYVVPKWFSPIELRVLDAPTADAEVVLASLGHETEAVTGAGQRVARDTSIAGTEWPESDSDSDNGDDDNDHGASYGHSSGRQQYRTESTLGARGASDVKGYTIGDEEEDNDNRQLMSTGTGNEYRQATPPINVDPDGYYRTWVGQSSADNTMRSPTPGLPQAESDALPKTENPTERREIAPASLKPPKEAKRSKSVTQSWWGTGGGEAVQRAPTPHSVTPAVSSVADVGSSKVADNTPLASAGAGTAAASSDGRGMKSWFGKKKPLPENQYPEEQEVLSPEAAETFTESPTAASSALGADEPGIPGGMSAMHAPSDTMSDHRLSQSPNLFAAGGRSPSEVGAAAAASVRDTQMRQQSIDAAVNTPTVDRRSDVAMPSNIPANIPIPEQHRQQQHKVSIDAANPHHVLIQTTHPGTPISTDANGPNFQMHQSAQHPESATPSVTKGATSIPANGGIDGSDKQSRTEAERVRAQEDLRSKEVKEEEKVHKKEERQREKDEKLRRKDEKELKALLERQAKERAAAETKRAKLQQELREIEKRAAISVSTEAQANELPVPKVSQRVLSALANQVAGHEGGVHVAAGGAYVIKPCLPTESEFYRAALLEHPRRMSKSQLTLLKRLKTFLPTYHGLLDIVQEISTQTGSVSSTSPTTRAVMLENLTRDYKFANVLDIKLGKQLWDDSATYAKRSRMEETAAKTTSGSTGIRLTGWQTWSPSANVFARVDKTFGKSIQASQLEAGLRCFFGLGSEADAQVVADHGQQRFSSPILPAKNVGAVVDEGVLPAVDEIIDIVKKLQWRVRGGSLLVVFEGDLDTLTTVTKKSDLWAGRRGFQGDALIDASHLEQIPEVSQQLRLVDVRLIDFAHATFTPTEGRDDGILAGLETLRSLLGKIVKDAHKGRIGSKTIEATVTPMAAAASATQSPSIISGKSKDKRVRKSLESSRTAKTAKTLPNNEADDSDKKSAKLERRKSSRFFGFFGSNDDKNRPSKDPVPMSKEAASQREPSITKAKEAPNSNGLGTFAFERDHQKGEENGTNTGGREKKESELPTDVAIAAASGAGVGALLASQHEGAEFQSVAALHTGAPSALSDSNVRSSSAEGLQADEKKTSHAVLMGSQPTESYRQQHETVDADGALDSITGASEQDKGKGKAKAISISSQEENDVDDETNQQREHPHGKGLLALIRSKSGTVVSHDNTDKATTSVEKSLEAHDDDSHDKEAAAAAASGLGGAAFLAKQQDTKTHPDKQASVDESHSEKGLDASDSSEHGKRFFGLFRKSDKSSHNRKVSATSDRDEVSADSKRALDQEQAQAEPGTTSTEDSESKSPEHRKGVLGLLLGKHDSAESTDENSSGIEAMRGQSRVEVEKQLQEQQEAQEKESQQALQQNVDEKSASDTSNQQEQLGFRGLFKTGAPSALDALGGDKSAKEEDNQQQHVAGKAPGSSGSPDQTSKVAHEEITRNDDAAPLSSTITATPTTAQDEQVKSGDSSASPQNVESGTAKESNENRRHGFLGLFKKGDKDANEHDAPRKDAKGDRSAASEKPLGSEVDKSASAATPADKPAESDNHAGLAASAAVGGAAAAAIVAPEKHSEDGHRKKVDTAETKNAVDADPAKAANVSQEQAEALKQKENERMQAEAMKRDQAEALKKRKEEERNSFAAAAALKHEEQENAEARGKQAQEDIKAREKKDKEEAKARKKQAKEQAKLLKKQEKKHRKEQKDEEKRKSNAEKEAEKERAATGATLAAILEKKRNDEAKREEAQRKAREEKFAREKKAQEEKAVREKKAQEEEEAREKKAQEEEAARKKKAQEEEAAREKKARDDAVALTKEEKDTAALAEQRHHEEEAFEKHKAELAVIEQKRSEEQAALDAQKKEAAELEKQRREDEAALKLQKEELAALRKKRLADEAALEKQRKEAADLRKKREEEEATIAQHKKDAAELEKKQQEEAALFEKRKAEATQLKKSLHEREAASTTQREETSKIEKQRKADEAAIQKQKKEAAALEKKAEKETGAGKNLGAEAAEAEKKRQREMGAQEAKAKGQRTSGDDKPVEKESHDGLGALAAGAGATALASAALSGRQNEDKSSEDEEASTAQDKAGEGGKHRRGLGVFASLRRKSHSAAKRKEQPAVAEPKVEAPQISGAPAGDRNEKQVRDERAEPALLAAGTVAAGGAAADHNLDKGKQKATSSRDQEKAQPSEPEIAQGSSASVEEPKSEGPPTPEKEAPSPNNKEKASSKAKHRSGLLGLLKGSDEADYSAGKTSQPSSKNADSKRNTAVEAPAETERSFVKVGIGRKGRASEENARNAAISLPQPAPVKRDDNAEGLASDPSQPSTSAPRWPAPVEKSRPSVDSTTSASTSKKPRKTKTKGAPAVDAQPESIVEEVFEKTRNGTRRYLAHTNPPRGAGKAPSAVQWRNQLGL